MKILLKGARVIDPTQKLDGVMDILITDGKITNIGVGVAQERIKKAERIKEINLAGLVVVPGLIDMHTHLRDPGFEYKETIATGAAAAVAGGFCAIACMPNTNPVNDSASICSYITKQTKVVGLARVYPIGAITLDSKGETLTDFFDLQSAGAVALSDDGKPVSNPLIMRYALEYAASLNIPIISHCEDLSLSANGVANEGFSATELGLAGSPTIAEDVMVARDIIIAEYLHTSVHIAHVSSAGAVKLIRDAKGRGVKVTAETAPHYFTLTEDALYDYDTNTKVNPPLRSADDVAEVKKGLKDGTIDCIASDHAPHAATDKEVEFDYAANGIIGLETSLGLSMKLISAGVLSLKDLICKMSCNPARILRINGGSLRVGDDADITVIDTKRKWTVDKNLSKSKSRNAPFHGVNMQGKAVMTIVGGQEKFVDELVKQSR